MTDDYLLYYSVLLLLTFSKLNFDILNELKCIIIIYELPHMGTFGGKIGTGSLQIQEVKLKNNFCILWIRNI